MAGDPALLDALAKGGTAAAQQYQASKAASDAASADAIRAALSSSVAQQASPGAQYDLARIIQAPVGPGQDLMARQTYGQLAYQNSIGNATQGYLDTLQNSLIPAYKRELALGGSGGSGGGGGGGGGGGRSGGGGGRSGGGRSKSAKVTDWIDQLRADAGLVGTGKRTKTAAPEFLRQASKAEKGSLGDIIPRDLRERQYLQDHYGAPVNELDKAAPISGFLKAALDQLQSAVEHKISYKRYAQDTHKAARNLPGDQRRAVRYALALAQQHLDHGNPLVNAGLAVSSAPKTVAQSISQIRF